jgi:hypothetical protein
VGRRNAHTFDNRNVGQSVVQGYRDIENRDVALM